MLKRAALLCLALSCAVLASGCLAIQPKDGGGLSFSIVPPGTTPSSSPAPATQAATKTPRVKAAGQGGLAMVGTSLKTGSWDVQLPSVLHSQTLPDGTKAASGKEFFIINVAINNIGTSAALTVVPQQFALLDPKGDTIAMYPTPLPAFNAQQVKKIDVGTGSSTIFVYQLAPGTANLRFAVTPGIVAAPGTLTWRVP